MNPLGGTELQYEFLKQNVSSELLEQFQICTSVPGKVPLSANKINILWQKMAPDQPHFQDFFKREFPDYTYVPPHKFIMKKGPQGRLSVTGIGSGLCMSWCSLYLHYKLLNPEIPSKVIVKRLTQLNQTFIRKYLQYVEDVIKGKEKDFQIYRRAESYQPKKKQIIDDSQVYQQTFQKVVSHKSEDNSMPVMQKAAPVNKTNLYEELKAYRLNKSREENFKAYTIFTNKQLEALVDKMPTTKDDLLAVEGFGETKADKYGLDIVRIMRKYL